MQVAEIMPDDEFKKICDAGVELVQALVAILERNGIPHEQATNVIAVAAAGAALGSRTSLEDFGTAVEHILPMWKITPTGITFGPIVHPTEIPEQGSN